MKDPIKIALQFIKFRPRSVFEVTEKLKSKGVSESEIKKTISVLKQNKLLDDAQFAKMWVRDRNLLKPTGSFLLKFELKKLGISQEYIDTALSDQDEVVLAKQALESKHRYKDADFNHQAAFLSRRGFSPSTIYKVIKRDSTYEK